MLACLAFWAGVAVNAQAAAQHVFNLGFADVEVSVTEGTAKDNAVYFVQTAGQITRCYVLIPHQFENGEQPADRDYKISVAYDPATDWTIVGGAAGPAEDMPYSAGEGAADPEFRQGNSVTLAAATRTFDIPDPTEQDPERRSSRTVEVIAFTPGLAIVAHSPDVHGEAGQEIPRPIVGNGEITYATVLNRNLDNDLEVEPENSWTPVVDWDRENLDPSGTPEDDLVCVELRFAPQHANLLQSGTVTVVLPPGIRAFAPDGQILLIDDLTISLAGPFGLLSEMVDGLPVQIWLEGGPEWSGNEVTLAYEIVGNCAGSTGAVEDALFIGPMLVLQAAGEDQGKVVHRLHTWAPCDGIGKGDPIVPDPVPAVHVVFNPQEGTAAMTWMGKVTSLAQDSTDPERWESPDATVTLEAPHVIFDDGVEESSVVRVQDTTLGWGTCTYIIDETAAGSNTFRGNTWEIRLRFSGPDVASSAYVASTVKTLGLAGGAAYEREQGQDPIYSNDGVVIEVLNSATLPGGYSLLTVGIDFDDGETFSVFQVTNEWTGDTLQFTNQPTRVPTNRGCRVVDDHVPFMVKVPTAIIAGAGEHGAEIDVEAYAGGSWQSIGVVHLMADGDSKKWHTTMESVVLLPHLGVPGQMTAQDAIDWLPLKLPQGFRSGWSEANFLPLRFSTTVTGIKHAIHQAAEHEAMVVKSLSGRSATGTSAATTRDLIAKPLDDMGYTVYVDFDAKTSDAKEDYMIGKNIWYSLSHGAATGGGDPFRTLYGTTNVANQEFAGLSFDDWDEADGIAGLITTQTLADIKEDHPPEYRLVIADACLSAQVALGLHQAPAANMLFPQGNAATFAASWGAQAAYVGWAWSLPPRVAQETSGKMIAELAKGETVAQAVINARNASQAASAQYMRFRLANKDRTITLVSPP